MPQQASAYTSQPAAGSAVSSGAFQLPEYGAANSFQPEADDPAAHQQLLDLLHSIQGSQSQHPLHPASNAFAHFAQSAHGQAQFQPADDLQSAMGSSSSGLVGDHRGGSTGSTSFSIDGNWDDAEFAFTPLVSPAMTPLSALLSPQVQALKSNVGPGAHVSPAEVFSPLTSPALQPQDTRMATDVLDSPHMLRLAEQAATLGLDGFQLPRAHAMDPGIAMGSPVTASSRGRGASRTAPKSRPSPIIKPANRQSKSSAPQMSAQATPTHESAPSTPSPIDIDVGMVDADDARNGIDMMPPPPLPAYASVPATPSSLMNLGLEPNPYDNYDHSQGSSSSTSPMLTAKRPGKRQGQKALSNKSNRNSVDFAPLPPPLNVPPEERRNSHRAAEQRRRDSLKLCFEELRPLLPHIPPEEDEEAMAAKRPGEGNVAGQRTSGVDPMHPNKGVSKVALLRKSNAYIIALEGRIKAREDALQRLRAQYGIPEDEVQINDWEENWPWNGVPGDEGHSPYSQAAIQAAAIANGTFVDPAGLRKGNSGVVTRNRSKRSSLSIDS